MLRGIKQRLPALGLRLLLAGLRRLDVVRCSALGGAVLRRIGPHLPVNRVAEANLRLALPELDAAARQRIVLEMWDNLGRTAAEFAHLAELSRSAQGPGWEVQGEEYLQAASGRQMLFFAGHLGNWEMLLPIASALGVRMAGFYRAAANPCVDAVLLAARARGHQAGALPMFPKGAAGARLALQHLAGGGSLGMLVDQKMNDGIAVPLFGRPAMTAPALAALALRFGCPLIPTRVRRIGPARFRLVCEKPLEVVVTGERAADVLRLTTAMNATLERWIREEPGAWLWMHRRWPAAP